MRSRGYRCRVERLESRSMMAADIVDAAVEVVPDEPTLDERIEEPAVDAVDGWDGCVLQVCELQELDGWVCEFQFVDDPLFIDDSCLMVTEPVFPAFEPVDIRVQFVSSESDSSWAAYYSTADADGVVQGVSVVASCDEPTIAAFVAEHADDPSVQISDYGDRWYISGFPVDLAPPVPEYASFSNWGGITEDALGADGTADLSGSLGVAGGWSWDSWSWDGWCGVYTGDEYEGFAVDGTSTWDGFGVVEDTGWSWSDWTDGDGTVMPFFYARGAIDSDWFTCGLSPGDPSTAAGAAGAGEMQDVGAAEPVAANPRSAAFADMGSMAAVAAALQFNSADTAPFGIGRRRR